MYKWLIILCITLASNRVCAQECFDFYKTNCSPEPSGFVYQENSASVSFQFEAGESREVPFEMFSGKDYRITICASKVFENVIRMKLIRSSDHKIIYDNNTNNYALNMEFYCPKTQSALIEISAPSLPVNDSITTNGCIGIIIEEMVSPKTGF